MCIKEHKLSDAEAMQLIKDYTIENLRDVIEFYLQINTKCIYNTLIEHHQTSFESGEMFSLLVSDFYDQCQQAKETEDQFTNEL